MIHTGVGTFKLITQTMTFPWFHTPWRVSAFYSTGSKTSTNPTFSGNYAERKSVKDH